VTKKKKRKRWEFQQKGRGEVKELQAISKGIGFIEGGR